VVFIFQIIVISKPSRPATLAGTEEVHHGWMHSKESANGDNPQKSRFLLNSFGFTPADRQNLPTDSRFLPVVNSPPAAGSSLLLPDTACLSGSRLILFGGIFFMSVGTKVVSGDWIGMSAITNSLSADHYFMPAGGHVLSEDTISMSAGKFTVSAG
jgi:hypothetical protein